MTNSELTLAATLGFLGAVPAEKSLAAVPTVNGGLKVVRSATYYYAGTLTELSTRSGVVNYPSTQPEISKTNFPTGGRLPKGTHLLVTGVRILCDTAGSVDYKTATYASTPPATVKNGELVIYQNGEGTLFSAPGTDVSPINRANATSNDDDFRNVVPFLIRAETDFKIQFTPAEGTYTNQLYKLELRCIELKDSDKA